MENNERWLKCAVLNVSSWCTEKPFLERRGPELHVFIAVEHSLIREAADQEWNAWPKKGYKIGAADACGTKNVEDGKHTSGGVQIASGRHYWRQSGRIGRKRGYNCTNMVIGRQGMSR